MPPLWDIPSAWQFLLAVAMGASAGMAALGWVKTQEMWRREDREQRLLPAPETPKLLPQQAQSRQAQRTKPPYPGTKTRPAPVQRNVTSPDRPAPVQRPSSATALRTRTVPPVRQSRPVAQNQRPPQRAPQVLPRRGPQWDD